MSTKLSNDREVGQLAPQDQSLDQAIELVIGIAHRAASLQAFFKDALPAVASTMRSPYAALEVRHEASVTRETYSAGSTNPDFWSATIQNQLTDAMSQAGCTARLYKGRGADVRLALLSAPVRGARGSASGAISLVVPCADRSHAQAILSTLSALSVLMSQLLDTIGTASSAQAREAPVATNLQHVAQYSSSTELAFALTNRLCSRDGCDQVSLAAVKGKHVRILAISGLDEVSTRSPGIRRIREAMEECFDFKKPVVFQAKGELTSEGIETGCRLHRQWHEEAGRAPVASIPLFAGKECVAIVSVRRSDKALFNESDIEEYQELLQPYAGALDLVDRAGWSWLEHSRRSLSAAAGKLKSRAHWSYKARALATSLFLIWAFFGSWGYEVSVPCTVKPTASWHLAAPFDGILRAAPFVPGDRVQAGDVLAIFDTAELELEIAQLRGELAILDVQERKALAESSPVDVQLTRANRRQVEASLGLLEYKLQRSVVVAESDGILQVGDLRERIGDSLVKGDSMFELAAESGWELTLEIPETDVSELEAGMSGRFASLARPEETYELEIQRVRPSADQRDEGNVFIAEAKAEIREEWIRSGMEGIAKVEIGERAPAWVALHRVADFMHLHFWL